MTMFLFVVVCFIFVWVSQLEVRIKKLEKDHNAIFPDPNDIWAMCKYCGGRIGSPTHFCPHCGKDIDRQYSGEK